MTGPQGPGPGPSGRAEAFDLRPEFRSMWAALDKIGRRPSGGFRRLAWSDADFQLRQWFRGEAAQRQMPVDQDKNGNLWAWWGQPADGAVATGSHLDSVPDGGAFDGPLGVVAGFLAVDKLRAGGQSVRRPLAVACFADEEGGRFGVACVGSRLMCGALTPEAARALTDAEGTTLADAMTAAGLDPAQLGPDRKRVGALSAFVELHIEQGRALVGSGAPVGLATGIWPHGRWSCSYQGEPNHAGTTLMSDRRDPMLPLAATVLAARAAAERYESRATVAKLAVHPNATNAIAAQVEAWLDARAPDKATLALVVAAVESAARQASTAHGVEFRMKEESSAPEVGFDDKLRHRLSAVLGEVPQVPTAAGHDAGILSAHVPTAMLFVRNRTGVSHSPAEHATEDDCVAGAEALARVLDYLTGP
jgi:N-carbamoyl-L-amino-acid hydrolase